MRRVILLSLAIFVSLVITAFLTVDYYHYSKNKNKYRTLFIPRLEVGLFEVTNMSADKTIINGSLLIHNPLPFGINVDSLEYKIYISNIEVIKSTYAKPLAISRWNKASITMPVTVFNDKLIDILKASKIKIKTVFYTESKRLFMHELPLKRNSISVLKNYYH